MLGDWLQKHPIVYKKHTKCFIFNNSFSRTLILIFMCTVFALWATTHAEKITHWICHARAFMYNLYLYGVAQAAHSVLI